MIINNICLHLKFILILDRLFLKLNGRIGQYFELLKICCVLCRGSNKGKEKDGTNYHF